MADSTYKHLKNWFLRELTLLRGAFLDIVEETALKFGVPQTAVLFLFENSDYWPNLPQPLKRSLSLMQEVFIWNGFFDVPGSAEVRDSKKITLILSFLAVKIWSKLFPVMEQRFQKETEKKARETGKSFVRVMEDFERGLVKDRFVNRELIMGLLTQWS